MAQIQVPWRHEEHAFILSRIQPFGLRIRSHDHSLVRFVLTFVTSFYSTFGLFYFINLCRFYFFSLFIYSSVPGAGIEPALADSESAVLPLNDPDISLSSNKRPGRVRTSTLLLQRQALCRLSYGSMRVSIRLYGQATESVTPFRPSTSPLTLFHFDVRVKI